MSRKINFEKRHFQEEPTEAERLLFNNVIDKLNIVDINNITRNAIKESEESKSVALQLIREAIKGNFSITLPKCSNGLLHYFLSLGFAVKHLGEQTLVSWTYGDTVEYLKQRNRQSTKTVETKLDFSLKAYKIEKLNVATLKETKP